MKVRYIYIALVALLGGIFWGCSDWTEVESKDFFNPPTDSYYEALREYKKSDHEISFGWFGNWTGVGASLVNSMRDSGQCRSGFYLGKLEEYHS